MSKFIAILVNDEAQAYKAEQALRTLHLEGNVTLYGVAVLVKEQSGRAHVKDATRDPLAGTALGMLTGSLIGILGGALAGPAGVAAGVAATGGLAGMAAGALAGSFWDLYNAGVTSDFVDEVSARLNAGNVAVLAEIAEEWESPLDTRIAEIGGVVVRSWRSDFEDYQSERAAKQSMREFEEAKAEVSSAGEGIKERAKKRLDAAKAKLQQANDKIKDDMAKVKIEADAKIKSLQDQIATAKTNEKAKLEKRMADLKSARDARSAKLKEAWELTKSALSRTPAQERESV